MMISTNEEFERHLQLVPLSPLTSTYKYLRYVRLLSIEDYFDFLSPHYGSEHIDTNVVGGKAPDGSNAIAQKSELIFELGDYVVGHCNDLARSRIRTAVDAIQVACSKAESAQSPASGKMQADPRYATCFAGAEVLASLAVWFARRDDSEIACRAIKALVELGSANQIDTHLNRFDDQQVVSQDARLIGFGYFRELMGLATNTDTQALVSETLAKAAKDKNLASGYVPMIVNCAMLYGDAIHAGVFVRQNMMRFHQESIYDLMVPAHLLAAGLKTENSLQATGEFVSQMFTQLLTSSEGSKVAPRIIQWLEGYIAIHEETENTRLLGSHLRSAGDLVVKGLRRTINPGNDRGQNSSPGPKPELT